MKSVHRKKIAVVATHPIQYQVPWFQLLAAQEQVHLRVYYSLLPDQNLQGAGFGIPFEWDIPMFEGYEWEVLPSASKAPSLQGFFKN